MSSTHINSSSEQDLESDKMIHSEETGEADNHVTPDLRDEGNTKATTTNKDTKQVGESVATASESVSVETVGGEEEEEETRQMDHTLNQSVKMHTPNGKEKDVGGELEEKLLNLNEGFLVLLKQAGWYGKWQWRLFVVTSFCGIFVAFHNLAAAFLAATPDHWCRVPELQNVNTTLDLRNISIPWVSSGEGATEYAACIYYDRNYTGLVTSGALSGDTLPDLPNNVSTKQCHQYTYDHSIYETTVVEEWDLVCEDKYRMSLVQSTYMGGVLTGAIVLSELSDKYGRRTISLVSAVGLLVSGLSIIFVQNYASFLIFRFLVAAFGSGLFLPNFVIMMECVGPEGRTIMGMLYQNFFAVGFMLLPAIAYFVNEWRYLQLCISLPSALLLLYYWFLPESPRWLMVQGRYEEALKILRQVAKVNGGSLPPQEELDTLIETMTNERECNAEVKTSCFQKFFGFFKSIFTLLSTPNLRRRCLIIFFSWFVVSMVYYGLTFSGGNINASPYLLVFLSGLVEIPSYFLVCWTLKKFGRRLNLCVLFLICGIACLLILAVPKDMVGVNMGLATIGKFFNSAAFGVAYIYSAELVPTAVRNIAVGTSSMCARIGSALAPFIVDLLGDIHYTVPSTVFGLLSVTAGLLALLLPETGKTKLPETVEEVEALPR